VSHSGSNSLLVTGRTGGWHGVAQNMLPKMIPGVTYEVSAWVKLANVASDTFILTFKQVDDRGTTYNNAGRIVTAYQDSWTQAKSEFTLDTVGTLTELTLYAEGPASGVDLYLDDVSAVVLGTESPTTSHPTPSPTPPPTTAPPTSPPTTAPTSPPTFTPTPSPTAPPTDPPTTAPTLPPTTSPTTLMPTAPPTAPPTTLPTLPPTLSPTTLMPTGQPASPPITAPTFNPTLSPTTVAPTLLPTEFPTTASPVGTPFNSGVVENGGFESGTTGWYAQYAPAVQISLVSTVSHSGSNSLLVTGRTGGWHGVAQNMLPKMIPGVTYEVSAWVKLANVASDTFILTFKQVDDRGTTYNNAGRIVTAYQDSWTQAKSEFTLDTVGTLTELTLYAEGPASGVDLYLDDVSAVVLGTESPTTSHPTPSPTPPPTTAPPTSPPTTAPTSPPTFTPTPSPTAPPTDPPTTAPTLPPTTSPTTLMPTAPPTAPPTTLPTLPPTLSPTTLMPTGQPASPPITAPTFNPTLSPTTVAPTLLPTEFPTTSPPTPFPNNFEGPFFTSENSSENVIIPQPPLPVQEPRTNCPHLESGLLDWHDPTTWGGSLPVAGSDVTLPNNSRVIVRQPISTQLGLITIPVSSELIFGEDPSEISMDVSGFEVEGAMSAGSDTCRLETPLIITLHGSRPVDIATNSREASFKGISITGRLEMHGKRYYKTWSRLAKSVSPGDNFLFLQDEVNWQPGQEIVLVTSAVKDSRDWHQNEELTVGSVALNPVSGVKAVVYLTSSVQYSHVANSGYQAEVGLLSRMITIQGSADDSEPTDPDPLTCSGSARYGDTGRPCSDKELTGFGGHIMVHSGGQGYVEGVELYRMGQTNVLGRYPMHFHVLGNNCEGCYFRDSSVHRSFYRCISVHGTHNTTVSENVAFDVTGYCYYLEDGVEEDNTISFNLAALIHMLGTPATGNGQSTPLALQSETLTLPADVTASGYYITNMHNTIVGNVASGGWAGFAFPVLYSPLGQHRNDNMRPANRLSLLIDGNTAHSTGWWWSHAGAFYFGGSLYYNANDQLVYNAGRDQSHNRKPCLVDKCAEGNCDGYCQLYDQAWNKITNSKTYLVPSVGIGSWSGRMEVVGYEAHDVALGLEALESGFWIDDMLVVCRTGEPWLMPVDASPHRVKGDGFFWYDTGQEHIVSNSTFRNCGFRDGFDHYDTSPTRGCDGNSVNGCHGGSTVFGFLTHSDQFTPELMQATKDLRYEDCGRRFKLHDYRGDTQPSTVSGRNQNWVDVDGTASGLEEPTLIGSGLADAGLWWKIDDNVVHDPDGPLEFIRQNDGPERGLGHIRVEWDPSLHDTVGTSTCGNGQGYPCEAIGRVRHLGSLFANDPGLPMTAQPEIVGPVGGFGWLLTLDGGSPKKLDIRFVEVDASTPLILAIAYPLQTSFTITANAAYCSESEWYSCQESFTPVNSVSEVRNSDGNTYYFDASTGLLYLRVIQPPQTFTGDLTFSGTPEWHLWDNDSPGKWGNGKALGRFSRAGVTLPIQAYGPWLEIVADCVSSSGVYCSDAAPTTSVDPDDVCSVGYTQVSYDKCCNLSTGDCEFPS